MREILGGACAAIGVLTFIMGWTDKAEKALGGGALIVIGAICFYGENWLFGIAVAAVGFVLTSMFISDGRKRNERFNAHMEFNGAKQELSVIKRGQAFREFVKIKQVMDYVEGYEPEKLHFGAATVGGITTGGTYKTGGYNYIAGTKETGKYILNLLLYKQDIKTITLSPELAKEARKSKIKKYVDKSGVIAVVEDSSSSVTIPDYAAGNEALTMDFIKRQVLAGYPTYEKCKEILDWLSQE